MAEIDALTKEYPPLEAWFKFAEAVVKPDLEETLAVTCNGPSFSQPEPGKYDVKSLSEEDLAEINDELGSAYEVILLRAGFSTEVAFVLEKGEDHQIIELIWNQGSVTSVDDYCGQLAPEEAQAKRADIEKAFEKAKDPRPFEFYNIDGQWLFLPNGW